MRVGNGFIRGSGSSSSGRGGPEVVQPTAAVAGEHELAGEVARLKREVKQLRAESANMWALEDECRQLKQELAMLRR